MRPSPLILALALGGASLVNAQEPVAKMKVDELYNSYCASCHGENLEGGLGSSLVDAVWKHGGSDLEIAHTIREGVPDMGMVPWKDALTDQQIRSLVIFIREKEQGAQRIAVPAAPLESDSVIASKEHSFRLEKVAEGEGILWALEFLPDQSMLVTQRDGVLWHFKDGKRTAIEGTPEVWQHGQGGLLEVQKHPDYDQNGWIYLGYSENIGAEDDGKEAGMTAVARGRIEDGRWVDHEKIFSVPAEFHISPGAHFGTRFVFKDGYLFFGIGDRGRQQMAQDLTRPNGKIHRIFDDGRLPKDNPFVNVRDAYPSIWSYGHRNPQGLDLHPETGEIWEVEHGPRGGDETNLIVRGLNYGWPVATYGMNYDGTPITDVTEKEGVQPPLHYWVPSIAICGIDFYEGDHFPRWKNDLFVSGMASQELHRLVIEDGVVVEDEIVFEDRGRIRDVGTGPDGLLYVLLIDPKTREGSVHRLVPEDSDS